MTTDPRIAHFGRLYRDDPDPWNYRTSAYEREKYAATLAALGCPHHHSTIEAGCSNGELGALLAARCDRYLGLDCAERAVTEARRRLAHMPHARVRRCLLPHHWPSRRADLIVLSEILYYLDAAELACLARHVHRTLLPGGEIVIVNWTGDTDTPLNGQEATRLFLDALGSERGYDTTRRHCEGRYRLLVMRRVHDTMAPGRPRRRCSAHGGVDGLAQGVHRVGIAGQRPSQGRDRGGKLGGPEIGGGGQCREGERHGEPRGESDAAARLRVGRAMDDGG
jgi:SAM-dependent methyltransferase